jgi:hypothetical protein
MKFEARVEELVESLPDLALVGPLLIVRRALRNRSLSCIAVCLPLSGMMRCANV